MSTKTKTSMLMKIIAVVLILASAAMLFLPWMKVAISDGTETYSGGQIKDMILSSNHATESEYLLELQQDLQREATDAQYYGLRLDVDKIMNTVKLLLRFAWSPLAMSRILGNVKSLTPQLTQLMELENGYASANFSDAASALGVARIVLLILLILTLAMAAVAVVCALTDHRLGVLPYLIFTLILLALFIGVIIVGNNRMEDALSLIGESSNMASFVSLRIGIGGILCVVLAVLGFVALFLPIGREPVPAGAAGGVRSAGWTCPGCGSKRKASEKFCLNCGTRQPDPAPARPLVPAGWKCPTCGTMLRADQRFCLYCGTKQPEKAAPASEGMFAAAGNGAAACAQCGAALKPNQKFCPRCGAKQPESAAPVTPVTRAAAPSGWICPGCGAKLKTTQKFCPRCGAKQPEQAAPAVSPAPSAPLRRAPSGWTCPTCSAKLKDNQKFCPTCGTKQPEGAAPVTPATRPALLSGWTCPGCGAKLKATQKFCPTCGAKQPEGAAPAAPAGWTCPGCGNKLNDSQKFCPRCGAGKPEPAAPAPEPTPAPAVCALCGTTLLEGMPFCPKCGTRVEEPKESDQPAPAAPEPEIPAVPEAESTVSVIPENPEIPAAPEAPRSDSFLIPGDDDL